MGVGRKGAGGEVVDEVPGRSACGGADGALSGLYVRVDVGRRAGETKSGMVASGSGPWLVRGDEAVHGAAIMGSNGDGGSCFGDWHGWNKVARGGRCEAG